MMVVERRMRPHRPHHPLCPHHLLKTESRPPENGESAPVREDGGVIILGATPIGNLGDATRRLVETLERVALVAAEDTRVTQRL